MAIQTRFFSTGCLRFKNLNINNMNQKVRVMEYAVRGALVMRATQLEKAVSKKKKLPFKYVLKTNVGDAHAMGQKPITFYRQVLSAVLNTTLLSDDCIPCDVKRRVREVLCSARGHSIGAYSDSLGLEVVRKQVACFIEDRDGHPCDYQNIYLSNGASTAIHKFLQLINEPMECKQPGILGPIPQYPLYSAETTMMGIVFTGYYLDEEHKWGLDVNELARAYCEANKVSVPRALVVINPGNPTGQVLSLDNIRDVIEFCCENKLIIMADEVYQDNIYDHSTGFHSFKKVMMDMGSPYDELELASFMSGSKGFHGECGLRAGVVEMCNFDPEVQAQWNKGWTPALCPSTIGQAVTYCIAKPPECDEPSHTLYEYEKSNILNELSKRGELLQKGFNNIPGVHCNVVQGALYCFPKIDLPKKVIQTAKQEQIEPDMLYARALLEETGICVIPGSGFKQFPGTYHFRTTLLPQTRQMEEMLESFEKFHKNFLDKNS